MLTLQFLMLKRTECDVISPAKRKVKFPSGTDKRIVEFFQRPRPLGPLITPETFKRSRLNALQRRAWQRELDRHYYEWRLKKEADNPTALKIFRLATP